MDSPLLACFDPLVLDMLRDLATPGAPLDISAVLERANAKYPAMASYTVPNFRTGVFKLDPRDIKKFGDEDDEFDYCEGEQDTSKPGDNVPAFPFATVDSGTLIFADVAHLPKLLTLLTWEQYDRSLGDETVLPKITEELGGPYFAVILSDSTLRMQFDGDGTYTIPASSVKRSDG
jgi:hypothetical protein